MTRLAPGHAVTRELAATYRGRPLIVQLSNHFITLREKGRRGSVAVPILAIYDLGFKLRARETAQTRLRSPYRRPR